MRKSSLFFCILLVVMIVQSLSGRIFFVGSNPYLSFGTYPQDVLRFNGEFVYYQPSYQKLPWWGDIDEPTKRPNDTYTATGENITESNGANFEHSGAIRVIDNQLGLSYSPRDSFVHFTDIDYAVDAYSNEASGELTDNNTGGIVPFTYDIRNSRHKLYLRSILGFRLRELPCGVSLGFGFDNTGTPNQSFTFEKDGRSYETRRLVWGWTTVPCNHIFGASGPEGDAWLQSEYAVGPLYRIDVQAGTTLEKMKWGSRFRYVFGRQRQFEWDSLASTITDPVLASHFSGDYVESRWMRKTSDALVRLYNNLTWKKGERYALNTLFFLGYDSQKSKNALAENLEVEDDAEEAIRSLVVEVNPNINIYPWKQFSYIDIALLLEYSYSRYNHTSMQWVGGGQKEGYWDTQGSLEATDEYSWHRFSYANENFFDIGVDMSSMFPLYGDKNRNMGLGMIMFINSKFTWTNKYYGHNEITSNDLDFNIDGIRKNFRREVWFNSAVSLYYNTGNAHLRLDLIEPLLYLLTPRTRVTSADEETILFEHQKNGNWASQEGVKARFFIAYDLPALKDAIKSKRKHLLEGRVNEISRIRQDW